MADAIICDMVERALARGICFSPPLFLNINCNPFIVATRGENRIKVTALSEVKFQNAIFVCVRSELSKGLRLFRLKCQLKDAGKANIIYEDNLSRPVTVFYFKFITAIFSSHDPHRNVFGTFVKIA